MIRFEQPYLRNEAGISDGGGGGSAAPSLASMPDVAPSGDDSSWDAIKAQVLGQELPQGNPGQQQAPNDNDPWSLPKPEPKPKAKSYEERLAARAAKQQAQSYEQQLAQYQAQAQQAQQLQQQQRAEYHRLKAKGDLDGALRALGAEDFATLQREYLTAKGAIPAQSDDPHVQAMQRQLQQMQAQQRQAQVNYQRQLEAQRQQQLRQQEQQQYQEDVQAIASDLATLDAELPGASQFAQLDGFPEVVLKVMEANPGASLHDAAKLVRREYEAAFQKLNQAFVPQQQQQRVPGVTPVYQQPQRSPIQQRLPSAAGVPLQGFNPDELDPKDAWERIKNAAMNG